MNLIVDSNILFSSLISKGKTVDLLLNLGFNLYAPEFILEEFGKHKQEILDKIKRSEQEFNEIFSIIKEIINIIPKEEFKEYFDEARGVSPDPKDIEYFALALKLKCSIWSNDKKLKEQDKIKIYSTEDLAKKFEV